MTGELLRGSGNSGASSRLIRDYDPCYRMEVFDRLPAPLRRRLADATLNFAVRGVVLRLEQLRSLAAVMQYTDHREAEEAEALDRAMGMDRGPVPPLGRR